ncbi:hypothetical protein KAI87_00615, partial [Myxococcota bacterium]|nr:hypothetical protein [Myxococcota bacterium]
MKRLMTTLLVLTSLMACVNADYALFIPIKTTRYELPDNRIPEGYFEEIRLQTTDGVSLAAFWIHQEEEAHGTILYLHGQGGNLDYFWDWMSVFWEDGFNVLAIDYRGFGKS